MTRRHAAAAIATLALLTACGNGAPAATTGTTKAASTADVAYLAAVRPHLQGSSDADVISLGHKACDALTDKTGLDVASDLTTQGFSTDAAAAITAGAVQTYCPEHKDKLATP